MNKDENGHRYAVRGKKAICIEIYREKHTERERESPSVDKVNTKIIQEKGT